MEYQVVISWSIVVFENDVNKLLKQNWELVGGIATAYNRQEGRFQYSQAMVKKIK
jgi:hypothetical protein